MKKWAIPLLIGSTVATVAVAATALSVIEFLKAVQVNTTQMPIGWVRWFTADPTSRGCVWVDFGRIDETPKVGWKPAWDFINQDIIPTFGNPPLTAEQDAFCFGDIPAIQWVVKENRTTSTRPMYDGAKWLATRDMVATWAQTYRIGVGMPCESQTIRKTTVADYHWATNAEGKRDLTDCSLKK